MHLLGPTVLGIAIILLLVALVVIKRVATGSVLDKPQGSFLVQLVNIFNLFFLLVVNPLAAIGLITGSLTGLDPTRVPVNAGWLLWLMETAGLLLYLAGFILMGWALLTLGRNYQLGGSAPRSDDKMVVEGAYRLIRHPMYAAALSISLGLSFLLQSLAFFAVFVIYLGLILPLIHMEERELQKAYGAEYSDYQRKTRALVPAIY
jgi:protein-S-isoprenylcysteine O-methyltransferase Ste14